MLEVVLPFLVARLREAARARGERDDTRDARPITFFYQRPPSPRLQPPAADGVGGGGGGGGREHRDADYGHQDGEVNFWLPLTDPELTRTTLWAESAPGAGDFHPLDVAQGEIAAFHGTRCRHRAPPNESSCARVSLDFRVGVGEYFDPRWQLPGAKAQHTRREVTLPGLVS